jgi:hypothetical protein
MTRVPERWHLVHDGHEHVVQIVDTGLRRAVTWLLDGAPIGDKRTSDKRVVIDGGEYGAVGVRLPEFVGPARRVTWYGADSELGAKAAAHTGLGGIDLVPEPGSRAEARESWIRAHPRLYVVRRVATALTGVLLSLLMVWLLTRIHIPWPNISIPWPDWRLPSIPWPNVSIPWPDWELPDVPLWIRELLGKVKYVWPVLLALGIAQAEVKRRKQQDERRRREARPTDGDDK